MLRNATVLINQIIKLLIKRRGWLDHIVYVKKWKAWSLVIFRLRRIPVPWRDNDHYHASHRHFVVKLTVDCHWNSTWNAHIKRKTVLIAQVLQRSLVLTIISHRLLCCHLCTLANSSYWQLLLTMIMFQEFIVQINRI